ncbi:MAG: hypothetical protein JWP82_3319, partial [Humibacillus sp.]|nr:hypothetical protein [Humibacillus sp.]
ALAQSADTVLERLVRYVRLCFVKRPPGTCRDTPLGRLP